MKISEFKKGDYKIFLTEWLKSHPDEVFSTRDLAILCINNGIKVSFRQIQDYAMEQISRVVEANNKIWYGCPQAIEKMKKILKESE